MLKKSAVNLGLGFTAVCLSTAAFAESNDYYSYTQAPIPVATPAPYYPIDAGFIIGIGGGYADTHWDNIQNWNNIPSSISGAGFTAQAFLGYDFNRFFGLEAGYVYLPKATDNFGLQATNYVVDLLAKLSVPVCGGFSIHAKAGGGYLHSSVDTDFGGILGSDNSRSHIGPAFGVGASYEFIPNLAIGVDWMRYSGEGKIANSNYQPSPDAVFLNLSYKFPVNFS